MRQQEREIVRQKVHQKLRILFQQQLKLLVVQAQKHLPQHLQLMDWMQHLEQQTYYIRLLIIMKLLISLHISGWKAVTMIVTIAL